MKLNAIWHCATFFKTKMRLITCRTRFIQINNYNQMVLYLSENVIFCWSPICLSILPPFVCPRKISFNKSRLAQSKYFYAIYSPLKSSKGLFLRIIGATIYFGKLNAYGSGDKSFATSLWKYTEVLHEFKFQRKLWRQPTLLTWVMTDMVSSEML